MKIYLNTKTQYGVETLDQIDSTDFNSFSEFKKEKNNLLKEYRLLGFEVYTSSRPTKDWITNS